MHSPNAIALNKIGYLTMMGGFFKNLNTWNMENYNPYCDLKWSFSIPSLQPQKFTWNCFITRKWYATLPSSTTLPICLPRILMCSYLWKQRYWLLWGELFKKKTVWQYIENINEMLKHAIFFSYLIQVWFLYCTLS